MIIWPWSENPITLNMEESFIVTGIIVVALGMIMGFLMYWVLEEGSK